jgi:murein DD-endopeptidase MepM/ murein hydrolase activator NlpD
MIVVAVLLAGALTLPPASPALRPAGPPSAASWTPVAPSAEVAAVRAPGWGWPLAGSPAVVRAFDLPPVPWQAGHRGVDLAGVAGQPVLAAGAGVVAFAGPVAGRGVVSVDHAGGLRTTYEPVTAAVRRGDAVGLGTPLGTLDAGHPGCAADACLHWGLRRGEVYLNPLLLVRPVRVRLKPLRPAAALSAAALSAAVRPTTVRPTTVRPTTVRPPAGSPAGPPIVGVRPVDQARGWACS